jgi:hypothetical protein
LLVSELVNTLVDLQVVNRLNKDFVYDTLLNYGVHYDKTWIYDKIHHEINQFCSAHSLQQVYIDMFDQVGKSFSFIPLLVLFLHYMVPVNPMQNSSNVK